MRIGISVSSSYPGVDGRAGARYMIERARAARVAGLDALFVGDHHVMPTNYFQNVPILGRMLAEWGDRPAGALFLLPLWNPVLLAEQVATLACIAEGRFILQCGLGDAGRQSRGLGVDMSRRVGMFETALAALRALWAGETVSLERHWPIVDARIAPLPPEPIDIWVGAVAPAAIERTARLAEGWLAAPSLTPAEAESAAMAYLRACAGRGRAPGAVAIRRDIYIGATTEAAEAVVAPYIAGGYRGIAPSALVHGSVDDVVAQFQALGAAGYTDVIVRNLSSRQDECLATIERLADVRARLGGNA